mgnify:CR=1 FL=1
MKYKLIINPKEDRINDFLSSFKVVCPFQTLPIFGFLNDNDNYRSETIFVGEKSGEIAGMLSYIVKTEYGIPIIKSLASHSMIRGGPLIKNDINASQILDSLLEEYLKKVSKICLYTRIYNLYNPQTISILRKKGFRHKNYFDVVINLSKGKDKLWSQMAKNRRNGITKSRRMGVKVLSTNDTEHFEEAYVLFKSEYSNYNHPFPSFSVFQEVIDNLIKKGKANLFVALMDRKIISSILILCSNNYVYYWYGGSLHKYRKYNGNELLIWNAIEWAHDEGFTFFDFGGAGDSTSNKGIRAFKKKFGGLLINFGNLTFFHKPFFSFGVNMVKNLIIKNR